MKKAILVFPNIIASRNQYPTGLYKIASHCRQKYEILVLDERIENVENLINKLIVEEKENLLCIGLTVFTGEQISSALRISKLFHGIITIVWGGIHPSILPEQTIKNKYIDYIISGEGEEAFLSLLEYLDHPDNLKQSDCFYDGKVHSTLKVNTIENLDEYIDFKSFPIKEEYFISREGFKRAFNIETSRGCPYKCAYCHNSIFQKKYRKMSASAISSVLEYLISNYHIDGIIFQEDNFFVSPTRTSEILKLLKDLKIGWKANSRLDYFYKNMHSSEVLESIVDSNCKTLQFGIESGSNRILTLIKKGITVEQIREANKVLATLPIQVRYNFMVGFPSETKSEIDETFKLIDDLLRENLNIESPFVNIYTPYPGTELYRLAVDQGFKPPMRLEEWSEFNWNNSKLNYLEDYLIQYINYKSIEFRKKVNYPI